MWDFGNQNKAASEKKKKSKSAEVGVAEVMSLAADSHDITENKCRLCSSVVWPDRMISD